jgi:DedD protein
LADNDEAILLRRRARRRLVGAIALVVFAVIVLPIVFDKEPKPISQDIVIQIPSQHSGRFNTKVVPPPEPIKADLEKPPALPATGSEPAKAAVAPKSQETLKPEAAPKAEAAAKNETAAKGEVATKGEATKTTATRSATVNPAPASGDAAKQASSNAEAARASAALQSDAYVVPLGAFLNQANVKTLQAKVTVAGFKSYSEIQKVAKGEQIRVRAGPFPTREAAERAREQLQSTGLTVGPVTKL